MLETSNVFPPHARHTATFLSLKSLASQGLYSSFDSQPSLNKHFPMLTDDTINTESSLLRRRASKTRRSAPKARTRRTNGSMSMATDLFSLSREESKGSNWVRFLALKTKVKQPVYRSVFRSDIGRFHCNKIKGQVKLVPFQSVLYTFNHLQKRVQFSRLFQTLL